MVYNVNTKYVFAYEVSPMSDRRCVKVLQNNLLAPPGTMERLVTQNNECILDVAFSVSHLLYTNKLSILNIERFGTRS